MQWPAPIIPVSPISFVTLRLFLSVVLFEFFNQVRQLSCLEHFFDLFLQRRFFGAFYEERELIMLPFRSLLVPKASFLEILLLITLLLFPWWKRFLSLVIRGRHFPPEERCDYSYHLINCFWDFIIETFDEFRVCDPMHESGDSHALWCSLDIPAF
ncbi:hypothetical protein Tco_1336137 [Tanacetum coccineum]